MLSTTAFPRRQPATLVCLATLALCLMCLPARGARADATLDPALLPAIQAATFEVVAAKPADPLTYEKPLPMDLLPYQERTDKYYSVGTAFAIGPNTYVTAAHVLMTGYQSLWGPPALRDAAGKVYTIDTIDKFALRRDFVVFTLKNPPPVKPLAVNTDPTLNQAVYSVGNALGTGIVIRNGLYTSNTPEDQDGAWKWIRFSAAASPGNSGGPLLDQSGRVIGVVLMKSANENLNYALPMREVMDAPADLARYDDRMTYQLDVFDARETGTFKGEFKLPLALPAFFDAYARVFDPYLASQLKGLLAQQAANLFPDGQGSHQLLYSGASMDGFPQLITRNSDGVWGVAGRAATRITLPSSGHVAGGTVGQSVLFHLRKPDDVPAAKLHRDPKAVMDMLLKTGFMRRPVGPERVLVTSLGQPAETGTWNDRWGRHWQTWGWPVPYANGYVTVFALPTPDGYALLMRLTEASSRTDTTLDLRALTDFVSLPYDGTLAQWQDFLTDKAFLPDAFTNLTLGIGYGKAFRYDSPHLAFSVTPALQKIDPSSVLTLGFSFFPDATGKVVWNVRQVWLAESSHDHDWVSVVRHAAPPSDLDDSYQSYWKKLVDHKHPFDAESYSENDVTRINAVVPSPSAGPPGVLYTAYVYRPGTQPQASMKQKLDLLLGGIRIR